LGFFAEASVGRRRPSPGTIAGPDSDAFEDCVRELFGELPEAQKAAGAVYRDQDGVVTVSLWLLVAKSDVAARILELQRRTGCQVNRYRGVLQEYQGAVSAVALASCLWYYVQGFQEDVARWNADRHELESPPGRDCAEPSGAADRDRM